MSFLARIRSPVALALAWLVVGFFVYLELRSPLVVIALLAIACLPLSVLYISHRKLAHRLHAQNTGLQRVVHQLEMAEDLADFGRWSFDTATGEIDWSDTMYVLHGLDPDADTPLHPRVQMLDNGITLHDWLSDNWRKPGRYRIDYQFAHPDGDYRLFRLVGENEFDPAGRVILMYGVIIDLTEMGRKLDALDAARDKALRKVAEAQKLATTDTLTGLANRRRSLGQLVEGMKRASEKDGPLCIITFDVDYFKHVNDTHGHQVGDEVLRRVANLALAQVRAGDVLGRLGGEEFLWMLPGAGLDIAQRASERLRRIIEDRSGEGGLPRVTVSVGYTCLRNGDDINSLLARADAALYEAKNGGRNRIKKAA